MCPLIVTLELIDSSMIYLANQYNANDFRYAKAMIFITCTCIVDFGMSTHLFPVIRGVELVLGVHEIEVLKLIH